MSFKMNLVRAAPLLHLHSYSISRALTEVLGDMQAVLIDNYAKALLQLNRTLGFKIEKSVNMSPVPRRSYQIAHNRIIER